MGRQLILTGHAGAAFGGPVWRQADNRLRRFRPQRGPTATLNMVGVRVMCFVLLLLVCLDAECGKVLHGRVVDKTGEAVFAANVFLTPTLRVAVATGLDGCFELHIPETAIADTLVVSFIGYTTKNIPLSQLDTGQVTVVLKENNHVLSSIVVESQPETTEEFSLEKLDRMDIYLSPVSSGDPLNAITFLPASTNTDESANPSFRGSAANASQVLLNGIPIANPVRNTEINGMGNFSLFNTSLIDNLTVYAGNPPLSKSNATAGVTDIHTVRHIDISHTECSLSLASIGILRSQMLDKQGNCFIQGYTNRQFHEPYTTINNASDQIESFRTNDAGLNLHFGKSDRHVEGNIYSYFINESFEGASYLNTASTTTSATNNRGFVVADFKGINGKLAYNLSLGADISNGSIHTDSVAGCMTSADETDHRFHLNATIKYYATDRFWIEGGLSEGYTKVDLNILRPANPYDRSNPCRILHTDTTVKQLTPELFLYSRYEITDNLIAGGGLRYDLSGIYAIQQATTLSGQANVRYTNGAHSLLLSGGLYHGHLDPTVYLPQFSAIKSLQTSMEYSFQKAGTHIEASLYFKKEQSPEFMAHLNGTVDVERRIFGTEISANQDIDHLRIGLSYTCLLANSYIDGTVYDAANKLPWWVKGSLQYAADDGFTFSLIGQIRPGTRYTPIVDGIWDDTTQQYFPVFGEYNSARLGTYSRIDLGLNKVIAVGKRMQGVLFATLSNLFNRQNEAGPLYTPDYSQIIGWYCFQHYSVYFGAQVAF